VTVPDPPARLSPFAPFRHRVYLAFWTGAFMSNIGTWMEAVGIGIYITSRTGQAGWTGLVAAAGFLPGGILGPVGGALADRIPRKRLLLTTTGVQTVLAATLTYLAATGEPAPAVVVLIVFLSGCANALGFPTFQAVLPDLVPREQIVGAVALSSAQWNLGRVIGPALAGIVIAAGGYAWAFAINTLSFFAVIAAVSILHLPPPKHDGSSILRAIKQGVGYVRRDPGLRVVTGYMLINTFLAAPFIALVPYMSLEVLGAGKAGTSLLVTVQGLGAVIMALSLAWLAARFTSRRVMLTALWSLPFALALYGVMPNLALTAVMLFLVGLVYFGALSSFMSIAQLRAPAAIRGRVVSLLAVILGVLYPLGAVVQGKLADQFGLREVTVLAGALMLVALVIMKLWNPRFADALELPPAPLDPAQTAPTTDGASVDGIPLPSADPL
jgi:MFS family permease